jgi:MerR family copper efflux transcriptional regulator
MSDGQGLKIGDVAQATGLTADTVRFYEKEGLLGTVRRTSGIRRYDPAAVRRLDFVRKAVGLGFSLAEIRSLLSLRVSSRTSCAALRERVVRKLAHVDDRLAELGQIRDALAKLAATCATTAASAPCPFLDALDLPVELALAARPRKRA